jgi:rhomboid family GlyGly-CTERM serine protease
MISAPSIRKHVNSDPEPGCGEAASPGPALWPGTRWMPEALRNVIAKRRCTLLLAASATVIWAAAAGDGLLAKTRIIEALELTRQSIFDGRWWTICTGPLLHVSFHHLIFDVLGLLIVGWIFEPMLRRGMMWIVLAINVAVAIAAFAIYPDLDSYCGLSALDQGLLAAGAVALAMSRNTRPALIIAGVLALKWFGELAFDQSSLGLVSSDASRYGEPVPWCHAVGGMAGALSAWVYTLSSSFRKSHRKHVRLPCLDRPNG